MTIERIRGLRTMTYLTYRPKKRRMTPEELRAYLLESKPNIYHRKSRPA